MQWPRDTPLGMSGNPYWRARPARARAFRARAPHTRGGRAHLFMLRHLSLRSTDERPSWKTSLYFIRIIAQQLFAFW